MSLKRKPPKNNVRRVRSMGTNLPGVTVNKEGNTVQFESFAERLLTLQLERDPSVLDYRSQPMTITFSDPEKEKAEAKDEDEEKEKEKEKKRKYTPDFQVWRQDGSIEIHEVTRTERQGQTRIQERKQAAEAECKAKGWKYIEHTEQTLPQQTEATNLQALYPYRLEAYRDENIVAAIYEQLKQQPTSIPLYRCMKQIAYNLDAPEHTIFGTLCHLLWHNRISTNLQILLIDACMFTPQAMIWLTIP